MRRQGVCIDRDADERSERSGIHGAAADRPAPTGIADRTAPAPTTGTGPATPIAPMVAAVVQPILVSMGQNEAQGAQPDGSPFAGQFAAGQTLEQVINIKGNGCYTIVGASVGIQQLDITLVIQPTPLARSRSPSRRARAQARTRRSAARPPAAGATRRRSPARAR